MMPAILVSATIGLTPSVNERKLDLQRHSFIETEGLGTL